jgi:peptidoglycan hydrolase-like protein with peptidoglycan-binding domain
MRSTLFALAMAALVGCSAHKGSGPPQAATAGQSGPGEAAAPGYPAAELSPEQVRLVQRALADRGYAVDLTGAFDSRTQSALAKFQRARGLPANGTLDSSTLETLGIDPRDVMPVRGTDDRSDHGGEKPR